MNNQFDIEDQWGQYIEIDYDQSKKAIFYTKNTTPYDVNKRCNTYLHPIKEEKHIMDRESIKVANNWKYNRFVFGNICLKVIDVYFYACSFYRAFYKSS
mgnify:FL=1